MLMALSLLISRINYSAHVNNFIDRKTIEEKNKELDHLYKINEERLRERTEELSQIIELEKLRVAFLPTYHMSLEHPSM